MYFRTFRKALLGVALLAGSISACTKTDCPAFADAAFDAWFPYVENQQVYFTDAENAKDTLWISSTYRAPEHKQYGGGDCNTWANISSFAIRNMPRFYVSINKFSNGNSLSVILNEFNLKDATLGDEAINVSDNTYSSAALSNVTLQGKTFEHVIAVQRDTTANKAAGLYKIWLAKGVGLVAYEQFPTHQQWVKQ